MRLSRWLSLTFMIVATASEPALAQPADTVTCPEAIAAIAACYTTKLDTGAYLIAAVPQNWNGTLIVFAHGGPGPIQPSASYGMGNLRRYGLEVKLGFAWIASTYRHLGFGVQQSANDTDQARQYFIDRFGKPKRIIIHGASYGGLVGAMLIERYGANYDGAFFNSGMLAGAIVGYRFRADLRAVYQYYCKNLPREDEPQYPIWRGLPAESRMTPAELTARIDECTGITKSAATRTELQKKNLANILAVGSFRESVLIRHMQYGTFNFRDIANITHGKSPFSNVHSIYRGSDDDEALNRGVIRFEADAAGIAALRADAEPKAALAIPVMAIHSINDPQVSVNAEAFYRDLVKATGSVNKLVQAYTDENEHTAQSDAEIAAALDNLMQWIESGTPFAAIGRRHVRKSSRGPARALSLPPRLRTERLCNYRRAIMVHLFGAPNPSPGWWQARGGRLWCQGIVQSAFRLATARSQLPELYWLRVSPPKATQLLSA